MPAAAAAARIRLRSTWGEAIAPSGRRLVLSAMAIVAMGGCRHHLAGLPPPPPSVAPIAPATTPAPSIPNAPLPEDDYGRMKRTDLEAINRMGLLLDVHFDSDSARIRDVDRALLARNAEILRKLDFLIVTVQWHSDELGTVQYNLALAERRAKAVRDHLVALRVAGTRLKTTSSGKEAPVCPQHTEECWRRNRRVHLTVSGKAPARH
jgi:peptidoglycan-associated lipoprotein